MNAPTPCVPPDPSVSGLHWLEDAHGNKEFCQWIAPTQQWRFVKEVAVSSVTLGAMKYRYCRDAPSPSELAATARAHRESDDAIAELAATIEELRARIATLTTALDEKTADALYEGQI